MKTLPFHIAHFHDRPRQLVAIRHKLSQIWVSLSWSDYQSYIRNVFYLLESYGLKQGDRVAIYSNTRFEWAVCDLACFCMGLVTVPIYGNASKEDIALILNETAPKLLIVGDQDLFDRAGDLLSSLETRIISLDPVKPKGAKIIATLSGELNTLTGENSQEHFLDCCHKIRLEDTATVVYTSGTSGQPKGIVLTHLQVLSEVTDVMSVFPITSSDVTLSFLPYAHILGRVEMWLSAYSGFTLAFAENIERLRLNLLEVQPTVLIAVPRIFEKIHSNVVSKLNSSLLAQKLKALEQKGLWSSLATAPLRILLNHTVDRKLNEALGGRLKYAISGGAPLPRPVSEFFRDHGVLLLEGYGLTETTGAICTNTPSDHHFGSAGKPLPDVKIKLGPDGEILVKSQKVFRKYLNPENGPAVNEDGYFATGDIGEFTADGFLKITDRKKDLIKTSGGKYVAPQKIESLLKRNPLISQVLVHGDQRKFIVVLITLDVVELKAWAFGNKIPFSRSQDLLHSQRLHAEVEKIVKDVNAELSSFETIKKFHILDQDFSIANGELTPSLKVKRKFCEQKYKNVLDQLYGM